MATDKVNSAGSYPFAVLVAGSLMVGALAAQPALAQSAGANTQATSTTQGGAQEQIMWGGKQVQGQALIGKPVMLKGERIGEVTDLIRRDNTYNDVLVRLDKEHSQMGVAVGQGNQRMAGNQAPTAVGGKTVAVRLESLKAAQNGPGIMLDEAAVTTLKEFNAADAGANLWTARNKAQR